MTAPVHLPKPVPNRPLNSLDVADGAFAILRSRPRTVATIAASFVLPVQLLASWLDRELFSTLDFTEFDSETGQFEGQGELNNLGAFDASSPITTVLQYLVLPFLGVALTHLVLGWKQGHDRGPGECILFTLKKTHIILVAFVLSKIIQVFTLLLTTPMLMLIAPIIAAEGAGPIAAISRAFKLGRRKYGQLLVVLLLVGLVNLLLSYGLFTLPVIAAFLLGDWGWIAFFALGSIGSTVLNILGTGVAVLAYFDVRNRTEGADLSDRIAAARAPRG